MRSFVVSVDAADAELAADRLWQLGVRAVEERTGPGATVELWSTVGGDDASIATAVAALDGRWAWRTEVAPDAWPESWRDHARPVEVGDRLVVVPAWWGGEVATRPAERIEIVIEPGAAFGLGDHPSTVLALGALEREMQRSGRQRVLDVGCGTGVLAVAAARLGAPAVRAVDISPAAIESTRDNAVRNRVRASIDVDTTPVGDVEGEFDLVLANILAPVLVAIAADLTRLTAPNGLLVVSGILAGAHDHVLDALEPMRVLRTDVSSGWAAVTMSHR